MTIIIDHKPHVLVIPYPAQGHVMPLMKLSCCLADRGLRITFVNTESVHARLVDSLPGKGKEFGPIHMVSLSDGLTPEERKDPTKQDHAVHNNLPRELEKLIKNNESSEDEKFACVIADETLGWALDVARKMGVRHATFFPAAAGVKAVAHHIPKLIEMGAIDENGNLMKNDTIIWSPTMPGLKTTNLTWHRMGDLISPQLIFNSIVKNNEAVKSAEWVFCNTFDELEHAAIALIPNLLQIGPLLASNQLGNFWPEDLTCLSWLDKQAASSVLYIAFGSIAIFNQRQFDELALGLELLGRPFLWVFRSESDLYGRPTTIYPDGFLDRVAHLGKIVSWAPQQKVLAHPAISCFLSHCGWNSVTEGVSMGVPFICLPYFADQFYNETLITNIWRVGLGLAPDEDGIISRDEISTKVNILLNDNEIKENALNMKKLAAPDEDGIISRDEISTKVNILLNDNEIKENALNMKKLAMASVGKDGASSKNLELFVEELRQ